MAAPVPDLQHESVVTGQSRCACCPRSVHPAVSSWAQSK